MGDPDAALVEQNGILYGTTVFGGPNANPNYGGDGNVFQVQLTNQNVPTPTITETRR